MGQAYRLPKRLRCEMCESTLSYYQSFFYIEHNQPYAFCEPSRNKCFRQWYSLRYTPDKLRIKGML